MAGRALAGTDPDCPREDGPLVVDGRSIAVRGLAEGFAWFDFTALCEGPRGSTDYIEIAREFHSVMIGGIPVFDARRDDAARRFVTWSTNSMTATSTWFAAPTPRRWRCISANGCSSPSNGPPRD